MLDSFKRVLEYGELEFKTYGKLRITICPDFSLPLFFEGYVFIRRCIFIFHSLPKTDLSDKLYQSVFSLTMLASLILKERNSVNEEFLLK